LVIGDSGAPSSLVRGLAITSQIASSKMMTNAATTRVRIGLGSFRRAAMAPPDSQGFQRQSVAK
jgi:hypothetical protein